MDKPNHIAAPLNAVFNSLPPEQQEKYLVGRRTKQVQEQFAACVDPYILDHVNSLYLAEHGPDPIDEFDQKLGQRDEEQDFENDDVSRETIYDLTVFVDNSLVAAELNAQRELVVLKFREYFAVKIDTFEIKISRAQYLDEYPFRKNKEEEEGSIFHPLTSEEQKEIDRMTQDITDPEMRASFRRVLKAIKEHPLEK